MNIGIMTFHRALNYGAFLQAFSLKKYLESLNCRVDIVDYWPEEHADMYSLLSFKQIRNHSLLFSLKYVIHSALCSTRFFKRKKKMMRLWRTCLDIDNEVAYKTTYSLASLEYDCLIYGSDQIWWKWNNLPTGRFDWAYWGDFVPKSIKKISYAASMGVMNLNNFEKKQIAQKLKNFQSISVREKQLQQLIQPLTKKDVCHVIDPVFLSSEKMWIKYAKEPQFRTKYVLLFNLLKIPDARIVAQKKAEEMHCDLVEVTSSIQPLRIEKNVYQTLDAFEFVGFVKNAEFVVTTSFHGTAFSILLKKQFYFVGTSNKSGRVKSLLESLNIGSRLLKNRADKPLGEIDYNQVSKLLEKEISRSKEFLCQSLGIYV